MRKSRMIILACLVFNVSTIFAEQQKMYHLMVPARHSVVHANTAAKITNLAVDLSGLLYNKYVFALRNPQTGAISYTNIGKFFIVDGYFNQAGKRLQGYVASTDLVDESCQRSDIHLSTYLSPRATTQINIQLNLSAGSVAPEQSFDPNNTDSYNYLVTSNIYDSLGKKYDSKWFFVKNEMGDWSVYFVLDDVIITKGNILFNVDGTFAQSEGLSDITFNPTSDPSKSQTLSLSLNNVSQLGSPYELYSKSQNGHEALHLTDLDVDEIGYVNQSYTNGSAVIAGKIAVLRK